MKSIAEEAEQHPEIITEAPHNTRISRLDETTAARKPVLRWKPQGDAVGK
jgi:glycine dehydrogenase subunit 2